MYGLLCAVYTVCTVHTIQSHTEVLTTEYLIEKKKRLHSVMLTHRLTE